MRQEAGTRTPALDRPRRQRRLMELLASAAGQARAHDALHHEATRDVLQLLGHILAETLEAAAAGGAMIARRENRLLARQMTGKRAALRLALGAGRRLRDRLRCLRDLLVLDPELKLVEGFGRGAETLPAQTRKLVLELLDQEVAVAQLGLRGQHHRLQRGDVVGQGPGFVEHGRTLAERPAKGKLKCKSTCC